ncbi:MAG TPA: ABC transporter ATP-binding protein [Actinomycetes bacterium]
MAEPAILVSALHKAYGDTYAVDGVDLAIDPGECFALLGPNGAGKTTTVEILEGYRHADAGTVSVLGEDPSRPTPGWRARIGIVLQSAADLADLRVDEVVRHFSTYYPNPRDFDQVISAVGLTEKRRSKVTDLSGGQRRRLDVALGIIGRPELLFLDEPTTGFDPEARREFWDLIASLRVDGATILLTTHYLEEAEHLADRVAVIVDGRIAALGDPATLGGRRTAEALVSWRDGEPREARTSAPTRFVQELAAQFGGEIPELAVRRPTLEDVYLKLVGARTSETDEAP